MILSGISPEFDVLTTTAAQLQTLLGKGYITSVKIVETYLSQIERHNTQGEKCRAILFTSPRARLLAWAAGLDLERSEGNLRGPLHGIPIILKDVFSTDVSHDLPTTGGSLSLLDACPGSNCKIVDNLIANGLIIIGKANMTELLGMKGLAGWSAVGGMCQPAYIPSGYRLGEKRKGETSPAGSSTGSAVGVACGFAPLALGSETSGSLVSPSAVAGLYALKLTPRSTPMDGILHLTRECDTIGAMGKSALDVAYATDALRRNGGNNESTMASVAASAKATDLCVGFLDIEKWRLPADFQDPDPRYFEQTECLRSNGVRVVGVNITPPEGYIVGDIDVGALMYTIINKQAKAGIERFLATLKVTKVHTLEDIVRFNDEHSDVEFDKDYCPNQDKLKILLEMDDSGEDMTENLEHCKRWAATEGIDKAVAELNVDIVVCYSDSFFAGVSVAARYPMATVPLGYVYSSGRPFGLHAIAPAHQEAKLAQFMAVWDSIRPPRRVPDLAACEMSRKEW